LITQLRVHVRGLIIHENAFFTYALFDQQAQTWHSLHFQRLINLSPEGKGTKDCGT